MVIHLVLCLLHLVVVALDLAVFFVLIRVVRSWWPKPAWLGALDEAGKPIVQELLRVFEHKTFQPKSAQLRESVKLIICMGVLALLRVVFTTTLRLVA